MYIWTETKNYPVPTITVTSLWCQHSTDRIFSTMKGCYCWVVIPGTKHLLKPFFFHILFEDRDSAKIDKEFPPHKRCGQQTVCLFKWDLLNTRQTHEYLSPKVIIKIACMHVSLCKWSSACKANLESCLLSFK